MKYYKIIKDNEFIGAINSYDFIRYQASTNGFVRATEEDGELVTYNNHTYRSAWMAPLNEDITSGYEQAMIIEIDRQTYNSFIEAIEQGEEIPEEDYTDEYEVIIPVDPIEEVTIDAMREMKLNSLSYTCRTTIEQGFDTIIRGETKHFSLTTQDQLNLMSLGVMAQTQSLIPYHADGEECTFYTAEEINQIIDAANSFKNYQIAYYNALKTYINDLDIIEDIAAIEYGTPIPDEYKSDVLKILE